MRRIVIALLLCLASVSAFAAGDPLPAGYLSVSGNQIVAGSGANVRLACIGYNEPTGNYASDMSIIRAQGFNCARYPYYDVGLNLTTMDQIVTAATSNNIRVIFDHHGNEATTSCLGQQSNGMWYDKNGSTQTNSNGTDGCGATGTITYAQFKANWVTIATRYAGNSTVIGLDLHNEPSVVSGQTVANLTWGASTNPGTDIQAMCQDVGNAIHAANAGVLVICEGLINYTNNMANGGVNTVHGLTDLSAAQAHPVTIPNKVVYSVHDYPQSISSITPSSGATRIAAMNATWGYLVTNNIAPVWLGEMGASLDNSNGALTEEQAWASMITNYVNGLSGGSGGPVFGGTQQPIGTDWWTFGYLSGQTPDGILNADNTAKPGQAAYWTTLLYHSSSSQTSTTWNPGDASGMTLTGSNLIATSSVTGSTYITPGSGSFTDGAGNVYTIAADGTAMENGVPIPGGGGTGAMTYYAGQVYAQDAATGNWFTFDGTNFSAASAPPAPSTGAGVRTTTSKTSGKYCVSVAENTVTNDMAVGIASAAESLKAYPGGGGPSIGFYGQYSGQAIYINGSVVASNSSIAALAAGDVVTVVVDATNSLVWFSSPEMAAAGAPWNHSTTASPTNGTGGISISYITKPYYLMASTQENGSKFTLNTTPSNCPAGVPTWDSVVATNTGRPMTVILGQAATGGLLLPTQINFILH
jgi:endoglucanase